MQYVHSFVLTINERFLGDIIIGHLDATMC